MAPEADRADAVGPGKCPTLIPKEPLLGCDRIKEVSAWFRQVATDDAKLIVISTK